MNAVLGDWRYDTIVSAHGGLPISMIQFGNDPTGDGPEVPSTRDENRHAEGDVAAALAQIASRDGSDRWLKRLNITRNIRGSRAWRTAPDSRIIH